MTRTVYCARLKREAEGLEYAPWPGELGKRIYQEISRQAWEQWLARQTMLINEQRINPMDPEARRYLTEQMQAFLFEGDEARPPGYSEPED